MLLLKGEMANIEQGTVCALPALLANCSVPLAAFRGTDELGTSLVFVSEAERSWEVPLSPTARQPVSNIYAWST